MTNPHPFGEALPPQQAALPPATGSARAYQVGDLAFLGNHRVVVTAVKSTAISNIQQIEYREPPFPQVANCLNIDLQPNRQDEGRP